MMSNAVLWKYVIVKQKMITDESCSSISIFLNEKKSKAFRDMKRLKGHFWSEAKFFFSPNIQKTSATFPNKFTILSKQYICNVIGTL